MTQKIVQIGNSLGIIIPKNLMEGLGLKVGEKVFLEKDPYGKTLRISAEENSTSSITPDFLRIIEKVHKHYSKALLELSQK